MGFVVEKRIGSVLVSLVMLMMLWVPVSMGAVYKVGDAAGWTTIGNVDYKLWSATKTFQVGDVIVFSYNPQFHNVMQVTHPMYQTCNASSPIATHTTGNDSITIKTHGHHFFLCGVPGHCQSGQKLDINVLRAADVSSTPTHSPAALPPSTASTAPAPSPSHAAAPLLANQIVALFSVLATLILYTTN
ncbi:PREDICTED: mavicyanin-like [Ipomoea nil]|uniref:mavicyanin-like n=1 Tax=Ipomoea nil TaxID=35883 RepID=UPI000901D9E3|nr:PREDICTED: mavicyanin-like [Ipomoea nil]